MIERVLAWLSETSESLPRRKGTRPGTILEKVVFVLDQMTGTLKGRRAFHFRSGLWLIISLEFLGIEFFKFMETQSSNLERRNKCEQ